MDISGLVADVLHARVFLVERFLQEIAVIYLNERTIVGRSELVNPGTYNLLSVFCTSCDMYRTVFFSDVYVLYILLRDHRKKSQWMWFGLGFLNFFLK